MQSRLSENEKKVLWIFGALRQMQIWGLMGGDIPRVTPKGLAVWDQIDKTIRLSDEEITEGLRGLFGKVSTAEENVLFRGFRDGRDAMKRFATEGAKDQPK